MDLIERQAAIEAVQYAMRNGGDWRPALEAVPNIDSKEGVNVEQAIILAKMIILCREIRATKKGDDNGQL